jgi:hypothetical protein
LTSSPPRYPTSAINSDLPSPSMATSAPRWPRATSSTSCGRAESTARAPRLAKRSLGSIHWPSSRSRQFRRRCWCHSCPGCFRQLRLRRVFFSPRYRLRPSRSRSSSSFSSRTHPWSPRGPVLPPSDPDATPRARPAPLQPVQQQRHQQQALATTGIKHNADYLPMVIENILFEHKNRKAKGTLRMW